MKLTNISSTIVIIGKTVILPGETAVINDPAYKDNDVIDYFIKTNRLALAEERPVDAHTEPIKGHLDPAQLSGMKLDDLKALAKDMSIDTTGLKKKADIVGAIVAAEVEAGDIVEE